MFAHPKKTSDKSPINVEGVKKGKTVEVEPEKKEKKKEDPVWIEAKVHNPGKFKYTVTLGAKLPIPGINYSSQEASVTVEGDSSFEEIHNEARKRYEEISSLHIQYFDKAVRRGNIG